MIGNTIIISRLSVYLSNSTIEECHGIFGSINLYINNERRIKFAEVRKWGVVGNYVNIQVELGVAYFLLFLSTPIRIGHQQLNGPQM